MMNNMVGKSDPCLIFSWCYLTLAARSTITHPAKITPWLLPRKRYPLHCLYDTKLFHQNLTNALKVRIMPLINQALHCAQHPQLSYTQSNPSPQPIRCLDWFPKRHKIQGCVQLLQISKEHKLFVHIETVQLIYTRRSTSVTVEMHCKLLPQPKVTGTVFILFCN